MSHRDVGTDDPRVHVRPGRRSRPRTKLRPDYSRRPAGLVVGVDRGRYDVVLERGGRVRAVAARELGRGAVVIGDRVRLTGDLTGRIGTLARIALVERRERVLRRSLEESPGRAEKIIVANADVLCIVASVAQPSPRPGLIDRCLVAAYEAGIDPVLVLTKCDLADPAPTRALYQDFDFEIVAVSLAQGARARARAGAGQPSGWPDEQDDRGTVPDPSARCAGGLARLRTLLAGRFSVLVGHSGVGKSSLINALVPGAARTTGRVNARTGHGRQTSTSARALALPAGGWVVDTPGVRSFGLAHVQPADVLAAFPQVLEVTTHCLPLCSHLAHEPSCALDAWRRGEGDFACEDPQVLARRSAHVAAVRRLLIGLEDARSR